MKRALGAVATAFSYFSVFPIAGTRRLEAPDSGALVALPLVGAAIGALAGWTAQAAALVLPHALVAPVAFAALLVFSGAIHVDGFLDSCDALFASVPPERRLEIMKDPRHGTFAVAGMAAIALLWTGALSTFAPERLPAILAFSGALARAVTVANALAVPYGGAGMASRAFESRPSSFVLGLTIVVLGIAAIALEAKAWIVVPLALLASLGVGQAIGKRLGGGLVGDSYGFLIVTLEVAVLLALAAAARAGGTP